MIASTTPAANLIDTVQLPADIWPVALQWQDRYGCWRFAKQRGFELMLNRHELAYVYRVRMSEPESAMYRHRVAEATLGWKGRTIELPAPARGDN